MHPDTLPFLQSKYGSTYIDSSHSTVGAAFFPEIESVSESEEPNNARFNERLGVEVGPAEEVTDGGGTEGPLDAGKRPIERDLARTARTTLLSLLEP